MQKKKKSIYCIKEGCFLQAGFGDIIVKTPRYCYTHKPARSINVKVRICIKCDKLTYYGDPIIKKRIYCKSHSPLKYADFRYREYSNRRNLPPVPLFWSTSAKIPVSKINHHRI